MARKTPIITLTSDFGTQDGYVATMKGVILSIVPDAVLIDVSHQVSAQDVMEGAYILMGVTRHFPSGTIHLVVVDPDVGSSRIPVALGYKGHFFVGPDNGLFSLLLDDDLPDAAVVLDRPELWRTARPSATFNGRDIFAPIAAHLAAGRRLSDVGSPTSSIQAMHWALPIADEQGLQGWIVHVDRFGNCITNISASHFVSWQAGRKVKIYAGNEIINGLDHTYSDVAPGDALAISNSSGFLEIAVYRGNASELLGLRKESSVNIVFLEA